MRTTRRAFTLVELLVVIGIIALLIAILMPALAKAREQANAVKCMSNERQMGQAMVIFANDHGGYLPKAWFNDGIISSSITGRPPTWEYREPMFGWTYLLSLYMGKNKALFRCPSDPSDHMYDTLNGPGAGGEDPTEDDIPGSYRLNISDLPNGPFEAIRATRLGNPSEAIVIADGKQGVQGNAWNQLATWEAPFAHVSERDTGNVAFDRHLRRGMYVFADGHAESLEWKATWIPRGDVIPGGNGSRPTMWRHRFEGWLDIP